MKKTTTTISRPALKSAITETLERTLDHIKSNLRINQDRQDIINGYKGNHIALAQDLTEMFTVFYAKHPDLNAQTKQVVKRSMSTAFAAYAKDKGLNIELTFKLDIATIQDKTIKAKKTDVEIITKRLQDMQISDTTIKTILKAIDKDLAIRANRIAREVDKTSDTKKEIAAAKAKLAGLAIGKEAKPEDIKKAA